MNTWFTSDIHFFHKNIIKYCPKSRGHFDNIEQMNRAIVDNFNSLVSEDDLTYILGDVSFGPHHATMELLMEMNGRKILIHGNHDRQLIQSTEWNRSKHLAGIEDHRDYMVIKHNSYGIVLFHYPIESWDGAFHGSIHLHGHVHSDSEKCLSPGLRRLDVGIDGNNLLPYNINSIIDVMSKISPHDVRSRESRGKTEI